MRIITLVLFLTLLIQTPASAETIYLKDGTSQQGQIVGENVDSYTLRVGGKNTRIFKNQIDRIEKDDVKQAPSPLTQQLQQEGYISEEEMKHMEILTDEKKALILKLLEINGTVDLLEKNKNEVLTKTPIEQYDAINELIDIDQLLGDIVPIYAKYYSSDELKQIISFYESPAGQKIIHSTPQVMQEVVQASVQYFQKRLQNQ